MAFNNPLSATGITWDRQVWVIEWVVVKLILYSDLCAFSANLKHWESKIFSVGPNYLYHNYKESICWRMPLRFCSKSRGLKRLILFFRKISRFLWLCLFNGYFMHFKGLGTQQLDSRKFNISPIVDRFPWKLAKINFKTLESLENLGWKSLETLEFVEKEVLATMPLQVFSSFALLSTVLCKENFSLISPLALALIFWCRTYSE